MLTRLRGNLPLWPLFLLVFLGLFPFGWLGQIWPTFGANLGMVFPTATAHAIGHIGITCLIGVALLLSFPVLRARSWLLLLLILLFGIGQELFQLAYKQRPIEFDEWRDLGTDLVGGSIALLLVFGGGWLRTLYRRR